MITVAGVGEVEVPPSFSFGGNGKNETDLLIKIDYKSSLQLISKNRMLSPTLREVERGDTISFEGLMASDEDGFLYVKLSKIHIMNKKYKRKRKDESK